MHTHMGINFEVWSGGGAWFWMVQNPRGKRAAIGAVASELGAIREAKVSIEEMAARAGADPPACAAEPPWSLGAAASRWKELLANLDRHLAAACAELACSHG